MVEHSTQYRLLYRDIDSMGVLYYARYLALFEMGRVEWMRAEGQRYRDLEQSEGLILPVTHAECRYRASLHYDDLAEVRTRVTRCSGTRIAFAHQVYRLPEDHSQPLLCATGSVELACVDGERHRPMRLPNNLREMFSERISSFEA